jgi:hypothetical protein
MRTIIFIFFSILFWASCNSSSTDQQLKKIDSLNTVLKEVEIKLLSIDTAEIYKYMAFNTKQLKYIQENVKDTVDKETAIFLSDIYAVKRSFGKLIKKREELIEELVYAKMQLYDLKKDVENKIVADSLFSQYFESEKKAILTFSGAVEALSQWNTNQTSRYNNMKPKIEEFVQKINE